MVGRPSGIALVSAVSVLALAAPATAAVDPLVLPDGPNPMIEGPAYEKTPVAYRALPVMYRVRGTVNETTRKITLVYKMKDVRTSTAKSRQLVTFRGTLGDRSILVTADSRLGPGFTVSDGDTSQGSCYVSSTGTSKVRQSFKERTNKIVMSFPLGCLPRGRTITDVYASSQATANKLGPKNATGVIGHDFSDTDAKPSWTVR